jgi:pantoate--beta-alanine ligase
MKIFNEVSEWRTYRTSPALEDLKVGFVPTMGALHEGHASLVRKAREENDIVVVSIFVNPTQFDDKQDLEKYPKTWEQDIALLTKEGVDYVLAPEIVQMYPDQYHYRVQENNFSHKLCGVHRAGHFDGVLTVVMKLFNLVSPHHAYFGEKDYQQLKLIEGMVNAFFMSVQIVPCPIVREADGLAMSSRNTKLSPAQRALAPLIHKRLSEETSIEDIRARLMVDGFEVEYVEEHQGRIFVAARLGAVRLIDNVMTSEARAKTESLELL